MQIDKALRREKKRRKEQFGMKIDGKSVFDIQSIEKKRADKIKAKRKREQEIELEIAS